VKIDNKNVEDDQKSFISSTNDEIEEQKLIIENKQQQQQILDLDEDAFFFTDSLLANNLQVALWRRELEQRLNPTESQSPSPKHQQINEKKEEIID
jgi:hypothetical protein